MGKTGADSGHQQRSLITGMAPARGGTSAAHDRAPDPPRHLVSSEDAPVPEIGQNGYLIYPLSAVPPGTRVEQATREIHSYGSTMPVPQLREAFEQLIDDLLAARLRVVLMRYPFSPEYLAMMPRDVMAEADAFITNLSQNRGLLVCGAWDTYADQKMFFNADHLNDEGARRYWPTIARCLTPHIPDLMVETAVPVEGSR